MEENITATVEAGQINCFFYSVGHIVWVLYVAI